MGSSEIAARVKAEIGDQWSRANTYGVDLRSCLVPPEKIRCRSVSPPSQSELDLWLVLTAVPESRDGYLIVCDQAAEQFGLAMGTTEGYVAFLGWYGGFWDALESM
jgi:hypothetical protein